MAKINFSTMLRRIEQMNDDAMRMRNFLTKTLAYYDAKVSQLQRMQVL